MKKEKYQCMRSKYLMTYHSQGQLEVSVAALNQTTEQGKKFEKPASKADMDNLLVTIARSITTHLREAREQEALKDREDDEDSLVLQKSHSKTKETAYQTKGCN